MRLVFVLPNSAISLIKAAPLRGTASGVPRADPAESGTYRSDRLIYLLFHRRRRPSNSLTHCPESRHRINAACGIASDRHSPSIDPVSAHQDLAPARATSQSKSTKLTLPRTADIHPLGAQISSSGGLKRSTPRRRSAMLLTCQYACMTMKSR